MFSDFSLRALLKWLFIGVIWQNKVMLFQNKNCFPCINLYVYEAGSTLNAALVLPNPALMPVDLRPKIVIKKCAILVKYSNGVFLSKNSLLFHLIISRQFIKEAIFG